MDAQIVKKAQGSFVVLDPTALLFPADGQRTLAKWFEDQVVLFTKDIGDPQEWDHPFADIALSKAFISWQTKLPSRQIQLEAPYLYRTGMTKYGGSAVDASGQLIVAFSGVEEWFDQMFSEMLLAAIKGICLHEMHKPDGVMADTGITFLGDK